MTNLLTILDRIRDIDYNIELTDDDKANRILSLLGEVYRMGQNDAYDEVGVVPRIVPELLNITTNENKQRILD